MFFFALKNGIDCTFQYPISTVDDGCALQEWSIKTYNDFKCKQGFEDYQDCVDDVCKFNYSNEYIKYYLDFAMIKGDIKIDI